MAAVSGGERRPSRDTGPIAAMFALILVGQEGMVYLLDPPAFLRTPTPPRTWQYGLSVFIGALLLVAVQVTVAAAVVSFLSWLDWYTARPLKQAPSVHFAAGTAAGVAAFLVTVFGLHTMFSARYSGEVMLGTVTLVGGLSMGVTAVDVIRNR